MCPTASTAREIGASLFNSMVCMGFVVVFHVRQQQVTKVSFPKHHDMVNAFPSDRADETFRVSILPR